MSKDNRVIITWTPERLAALKEAHARALERRQDSFTLEFCPTPLVTDYAKYLIEFLEGKNT